MTNEERVQRLLALDEKHLIAAEKATDRLIEKLDDPKTPHTALSNLIVTAFRLNGMLDAKGDNDKPIEIYEMTIEQLQQYIARIERSFPVTTVPMIEGDVARVGDRGVFD